MNVAPRVVPALLVASTLALAACGGGNSSTTSGSSSSGTPATGSGASSGGGKVGGTINVAMGTAPDYLDPQLSYTTQGAEADWISYLGLYTYAHANGAAGGKVIPALATDLPEISADGKTYEMTLRKGLKFSNGTPVKASDFEDTIERMLKVNWGGKSFVTGNIKGADAFDKNKAKKISGITTDDTTGAIKIELTNAYGAFLNVLSFPSAGIVPAGTKRKNLSNTPPPGVGPYMITDVTPNRTFTVKRNPMYAAQKIDGIPEGKADIKVTINSNTQAEAESVLNNTADVFDWGDVLPPSLLPQITSEAKGRYVKEPTVSTFYFFLNTKTKPFDNPIARQAVNIAIDRTAISRLASGFQQPACFFLPTGITGHPDGDCPYGSLTGGDIAKAKAMITKAGLAGTKVTVWGQRRSPRKEFVEYYSDVLNKIGFKASPKILSDEAYFPTIGNLKLNPQTGFADWNQDFPNPSDFYLLLDKASIQATNNQNFSQVADPKIQSELAALNKVPASELEGSGDRWKALDEYTAKQAYQLVFGQQSVPKFFSTKVDFDAAIFHPLYGNDWSSLSLK